MKYDSFLAYLKERGHSFFPCVVGMVSAGIVITIMWMLLAVFEIGLIILWLIVFLIFGIILLGEYVFYDTFYKAHDHESQ